MPYTGNRPGVVLALGIGLVMSAALSPAGLDGAAIPAWVWPLWLGVFLAALAAFRRAGYPIVEALRRIGWLVPLVLVFTVPAALVAPASQRLLIFAALASRALAAAAAAAAMAIWLGPSGMVRAVRQLGAPSRLADVFEAMLASLAGVLRQAHAMLRAREARRSSIGAWSLVAAAPVETARGFGRLVASLLLRALERAEALERARRARGFEP
ncbi:MAG: CbiQ family ECF transporter T component [Acidobacteriota bacterium]